jgi:hypothetical protein
MNLRKYKEKYSHVLSEKEKAELDRLIALVRD